VHFGMLWSLRNPPAYGRSLADLYRDTLEEIVYAEALGYHAVWLTEHHFKDDDYLPSVMPVLGAIAARTTRVRIGPYVLLMPFHHPVRLAEDAAVVDVLSGGRLDLAIGVAYMPDEFDGFAIDRRTRGRRHEEGTQILLGAWGDEPLEHHGQLFDFSGVPVTPKPVQRPIPIYLGGTSRPVLERVARLGVRGVAGRPSADDMPFLLEKLAEHGRDPASVEYLPFRFLWVDRDHERARRVATPYVEWIVGNYQRWHGASEIPLYQGDINRHCIMGSPEYCIERIEDFLARGAHAPIEQLIIQPPLLGIDHAESMRMLETFATEVMPHFAQTKAASRAANASGASSGP